MYKWMSILIKELEETCWVPFVFPSFLPHMDTVSKSSGGCNVQDGFLEAETGPLY